MSCSPSGLVLLCVIAGTACHDPKSPMDEVATLEPTLGPTVGSSIASTVGPVVAPWSDPVAGLRTRITATGATFRVGESLPIRLEIENVTQTSIEYSAQQVAINEPFVVTGPDGRRVGWVGITRQSSSSSMPKIAKGQRKVLVSGYDLATDYLICDPGVYAIASRKHIGFPSWPMGAIPGVPASKPIRIQIEAGDVPRWRQLMAEIHRRLPVEGSWHLHHGQDPAGPIDKIYCTFTPPGNRIGTSSSAVLDFDLTAPDGELPATPDEHGSLRYYLGTFGAQHAYLSTTEATRLAWPKIADAMRTAIRAMQ